MQNKSSKDEERPKQEQKLSSTEINEEAVSLSHNESEKKQATGDDEEDAEEEECVSRVDACNTTATASTAVGRASGGGGGRIIVSIESEPNIDRFARLNLHDLVDDDEDQDADDDMTPMTNEEEEEEHGRKNREPVFHYKKLEESSADEEVEKEPEMKEEMDQLKVEEDSTASECSSVVTAVSVDIGEANVVEVVQRTTAEFLEFERMDSILPETVVEEDNSGLKLHDDVEIEEHEVMVQEYTVHSPIQGRSMELNDDEYVAMKGITIEVEEDEIIIRPTEDQVQRDAPEVTVTSPTEELVNEALNEAIAVVENETEEITPTIESHVNPKPTESQSFTEQEIKVEIFNRPNSTKNTEEETHDIVIEEDISSYDNFVSIMQSDVLKETTSMTRSLRFPRQHVNRPGDFPKTMSDLITFDDEDMTDMEQKNLSMRKRQDSIRVKIQRENATLLKRTGHHRRYNMPAQSIDMTTRITLAKVKHQEAGNEANHQTMFPRRRQIFIPGNFPRDVANEAEYQLKDKLDSEPVRVQRITYTQPIVQLTMIREDPPKEGPASAPASQSVPCTPLGLCPQAPPMRRSRSVSPYIVDSDDPMMVLLKDTMEIPLVHNTEP